MNKELQNTLDAALCDLDEEKREQLKADIDEAFEQALKEAMAKAQ